MICAKLIQRVNLDISHSESGFTGLGMGFTLRGQYSAEVGAACVLLKWLHEQPAAGARNRRHIAMPPG